MGSANVVKSVVEGCKWLRYIIDVGQTMRAPGLYRVAKDYVIKERSMRILTSRAPF